MPTKPNPYPGPTPFEAEDKGFFKGRETEVKNLIDQIYADRIVVLHGPSGTGKTSLIQAGAIPLISKNPAFAVIGPLRTSDRVPTTDDSNVRANPYVLSVLSSAEAALALRDKTGAHASRIESLTGIRLDSYFRQRRALRGDRPNLLLFFDQFEQTFYAGETDHPERLEFFRELGELLSDKRVCALFVLRMESVAELDRYKKLIPGQLTSRYSLGYLNRKSAERAIRLPALDAGVTFVPKALTHLLDRLAEATSTTQDETSQEQKAPNEKDGIELTKKRTEPIPADAPIEPLHLQVVCRAVWDCLANDATAITMSEVDAVSHLIQAPGQALDSVSAALANFYNSQLNRVSRDDRQFQRFIREWVEGELIENGTIRRQVIERSSGDPLFEVQQNLESLGVLRAFPRNNKLWYELSHDRMVVAVCAANHDWYSKYLDHFSQLAREWCRTRPKNVQLPPLRELWKYHYHRMRNTTNSLDSVAHCELQFFRQCRSRILRQFFAIVALPTALLAWALIAEYKGLTDAEKLKEYIQKIELKNSIDELAGEKNKLVAEKNNLINQVDYLKKQENIAKENAEDAKIKSNIRRLTGEALKHRWRYENHDTALYKATEALQLFDELKDQNGVSRLDILSVIWSTAEAMPFSFTLKPPETEVEFESISSGAGRHWIATRAMTDIEAGLIDIDVGARSTSTSKTGCQSTSHVYHDSEDTLFCIEPEKLIEFSFSGKTVMRHRIPPAGTQFSLMQPAVSKKGDRLAIALSDGRVAIYQRNEELPKVVLPAVQVTAYAWLDETRLATGNTEGIVRVYELSTTQAACLDAFRTGYWHSNIDSPKVPAKDLAVLALGLIPGGNKPILLVVHRGSMDRTRGGAVVAYELDTVKQACSDALSERQGERLWPDFESRKMDEIERLSGRQAQKPAGEVLNAAIFSSDGRYLATGGEDGGVELWDLDTLHDHRPSNRLFNDLSQGRMGVISDLEQLAKLLDVAAYWRRQLVVDDAWGLDIKIGIDAHRRILRGLTAPVRALTVASDDKKQPSVLALDQERQIRLWDMDNGGSGASIVEIKGEPEWNINALAFTGTSERLLATHNRGGIVSLELVDGRFTPDADGTKSTSLEFKSISIKDLAIYGNLVAIASNNWRVHFRAVDDLTIKPLGDAVGHKGWVNALAFNPNAGDFAGRQDLVSVDEKGKLMLWDLPQQNVDPNEKKFADKAWEYNFSQDRNEDALTAVAFHPSEGWLLVGTKHGRLHRVSLCPSSSKGENQAVCTCPNIELDAYSLPSEQRIEDIAFSGDGRTLVVAAGRGGTYIWRHLGPDQRGPQRLPGDSGVVTALSFLPGDDDSLAAVGRDGNVRLWALNGILKLPELLKGNGTDLISLAVSSNGKLVAAGDRNRRIQLWDLDGDRILCRLIPRPKGQSCVQSLNSL